MSTEFEDGTKGQKMSEDMAELVRLNWRQSFHSYKGMCYLEIRTP